MPTVKVSKASTLSPKECFDRVTNMLSSDPELKKLDPKYKCEFDSNSLSGVANGSQFKAKMKIQQSSTGAEVVIDVDLPLLLTPVKGMVQNTLQKKLDKALA